MRKLLVFLLLAGAVISHAQKPSKKDKLVKIKTIYGDMTVVLYDKTPLHKANFIKLAEAGSYDSTIFHRVINEFMIQGGDIYRSGKIKQPEGDTRIPAEIMEGLFHSKGELAAARSNNPEKKSSDCQFYIVQGKVYEESELTLDQNKLNKVFANLMQAGKIDSIRTILLDMQKEQRFDEMNEFITQCAPYLEDVSGQSLKKDNLMSAEQVQAYTTIGGSPHLDGAYTVFGKVLEGMEVIDQIAQVPTLPGDKPVEELFMTMEVLEMKKKKITKIYGYSYD